MSLSLRQDWQLHGIERRLRKSEPEMAAALEHFARVNAGKAVNGSQEASVPGNWARRQLSRIARGWIVGAALSEGWLDPGRATGLW